MPKQGKKGGGGKRSGGGGNKPGIKAGNKPQRGQPFKKKASGNFLQARVSAANNVGLGKTLGGHATLGAYRRARRLCPSAVSDWLRIGQMKITVKCPTVSELLELEERCAGAGLNTYLIRDAGHTEIEPGSRTVLAVGPAPASALDQFTRHLKPY